MAVRLFIVVLQYDSDLGRPRATSVSSRNDLFLMDADLEERGNEVAAGTHARAGNPR